MPSNNCHIQTGSCMLIAVPLNASCLIVTGALTNTTAGVASLTGTTERQEGTDYTAPNFGGVACGAEAKGDTVERWLNIAGSFCLVDWAFQSATSGNPTILDGDGNVIGYATLSKKNLGVCNPLTKPRVAVAIARRAATSDGGCVTVVADTGATSIVLHVFPMTTDWLWDMPAFEDSRAAIPFQAKGYPNPAIGAGPLNLWPALADPNAVPDEAMHASVFIDPVTLPTVNCDVPVAHPVPAVRADD